MHLSAADAMQKLDAIDLEEKARVAEGIALIAVIDHRRDYLGAGYASMCSYCTGRLHMSEDRALKRIQVARAALRIPEIFEYLADGRLSVSTAATLAPHLEPESASELLAASAFRSRQELLRLIADRARPSAETSSEAEGGLLVELSSDSHAPGHVNSREESSEPATEASCAGPVAPAPANHARRGRVFSSASGGHEVRLSLTDEEHDDLRQAQSLLGHAVPSGDPAIIYARAMKLLVAHLKKQRLGAKPASAVTTARGRRIPKPLIRLVWERDGGRCAFVGTDGHRCEETRRLELDHIVPVAQGGGSNPENLRLLCRPHNQFEAERVLGKEHVEHKRELAQRERSRDKSAAKATAARAKARKPAKHAHHDDILAALQGLGFRQAEARRGAQLAAAQPEASLEACVRLALTHLTRAVVVRGERRARCSA
jgi:hypothetical protein